MSSAELQSHTEVLSGQISNSINHKTKDDFDRAITHFITRHSHSGVQITHFCTRRIFYVWFPGITGYTKLYWQNS